MHRREYYFRCDQPGSCCLGKSSKYHRPETMKPYLASSKSFIDEDRLVLVCENHYRFNDTQYGWSGMRPADKLCNGCNHLCCQRLVFN